jgi:hypothetical protein
MFGLSRGLPPTNLLPPFAAFTTLSLTIASICLNTRFLHQKHHIKTVRAMTDYGFIPYSSTLGLLRKRSAYNSTLLSIKSNTLYPTELPLKNNALDAVLSSVL